MLSKNKQKSDLQQIAKHISHIRDLVGAKYVALGTDYEGRITPATGVEKLNQKMLENLALEMQKYGLSKREIRWILSENVVRFFTHKK